MTSRKDISPADELFMLRAMELARRGMGSVSPNPMVGCVIVCDNKIIGEGWHERYGGPHAEVNAINAVPDKSLLGQSTVYVNLEPCSHTGKTPPCADLLVKHQVKRVVIANQDPNPLVNGAGLKKLQQAGIETVTAVAAHEGLVLNKRFFTFVTKERPYIILKWAQTTDGFIAHKNFESKWISHEGSRQWVHKWRTEEDAVLVGTRTAQHDNPELNVRHWSGRNPTRVVLDRFLRLSDSLKLFNGKQLTLCYNLVKHEERNNLALVRVSEQHFIPEVLRDMRARKIQSVIIEGGAQTLQCFIDAGLWDEARVFTATRTFGAGLAAPHLNWVGVEAQETVAIASATATDKLTVYHKMLEF
jgi:diaminohydroxyphosphoribosylaminopyrimidine deaminase / 5-amino-6-(5-phosphoribosylamino)uracil reductase